MKKSFIILALAAAALVGLGATQDPKAPDAKAEVLKLSPFVGEWTVRATWAGGGELVARNVNQWTLDGTHLQGHTFVGEEAERHQRYLTMMSYDAKKGCLVTTSYAVDGGVSSVRIETDDGKTFRFGFTPIDDEATDVRQTITFKTADEYQWLVEINQNGTWTQIMDGTWKRDQPQEPKK